MVAREVAALLTTKGSHKGCPGNRRAKTIFRNPDLRVGVLTTRGLSSRERAKL